MIPKSITLSKNRESLILEWEGGHVRSLPAQKLRAAARSADEVRLKLDANPDIPYDIRIIDVKAIGNYAVNLFFSDGYDKAIYPWRQLRQLSENLNQ